MAPSPSMASKSVDEYLARVPPKFRTALQRVRKTIHATAPEAEEVISYGMPAFRQDGIVVYYAAFKDHCSFFVGSVVVARQFSAELRAFDAGKGTLHFTPEMPLPSDAIRRIVQARLAENAARQAKKKR